jgi:predicted outer membrane repeat protein
MDIFIYESQLPVIDVFVDTFTVMRPTDYYASPIDNFAFDILHSVEDSLINSDVYVSVEGDNSNLGTSPETPFKTIKYALSRIYSDNMNINTIHLAAGIYSPTTNGESFPIKWSNYVNLSGSGEEETILDAENSGGVMEFLSVSDALIENLTITGGSASDGGGIFCRDHSNPCFKNVVIINNSAVYFGGGIYCYDYSNPSLENVELSGNSSNSGGGISCRSNSNPSLENVTIADNTAEYNGGGIFCGYSSPSLENVTITGNSANGNYYGGGGILCSHSSPSLINVTISNNFALSGGGINCRSNSNPSLENVTISDNSAIYGGGISCRSNSSPCLLNSILWNDSPQEIYFNESYDPNSITISYSDIQGGEAGIVTNNNGIVNWLEGNIDEDPLFVDPANGDYHLTENSPCIDAGNPTSPLDPDGTIADMGAYYFHQETGSDIILSANVDFALTNYPNPFNPSTIISFVILNNSIVELSIYNIKGQKLKSLLNEQLAAGHHSIIWDGRDSNDKRVGSGLYFYKLKAGDYKKVRKMILLK